MASLHQSPQQTASPNGALRDRPWLWSQHWREVLFLHWQLPVDVVRPHVPAGLEIDTQNGLAWVSIVPFRMARVRPRWLPPVPAMSNFLELNLRTYVRRDDKPGIYFLSIHAGKRLAVRLARSFSPLPYVYARMAFEAQAEHFRFQSWSPASLFDAPFFSVEYRPSSRISPVQVGSLDEWLLERYRLYVDDAAGRLRFTRVHHEPWLMANADATITHNRVAAALGLARAPDLVHFSQGVRTTAWPFRSVSEQSLH
jgi:uncharacterized protein YqjF (DUF2071 family)